jgi:hypothetical protein
MGNIGARIGKRFPVSSTQQPTNNKDKRNNLGKHQDDHLEDTSDH